MSEPTCIGQSQNEKQLQKYCGLDTCFRVNAQGAGGCESLSPLPKLEESKGSESRNEGLARPDDFDSNDLSQLAKSIGLTNEEIKRFAQFGISNTEKYNNALSRMREMRYSRVYDKLTLYEFLNDEIEGVKAGISAFQVKNKREKLAEEKRSAIAQFRELYSKDRQQSIDDIKKRKRLDNDPLSFEETFDIQSTQECSLTFKDKRIVGNYGTDAKTSITSNSTYFFDRMSGAISGPIDQMNIIFDGDKSLIYDPDTYVIKVLGSSNNLIFVDGNVTGPWGKPWLKQKWIDFHTTRKSNANAMLLAFERVIKACSLLAEPVKASSDLNEQRSRSEAISNKEGKSAKTSDSGNVGGSTAPRWSYDGELRPENWGREFPVCSRGKSQAPINIQGPFVKTSITAGVDYKPGLLTMLNNGHTIQVVVPPGSKLDIDGVEYELVQFHFHRPSEEKIDGKSTAMVVHFVHKSSAGKLAILVVFLQEGPENSVVKTLWANLPRAIGNPITFENISFNPANLLPGNFDFYTYEASLSTPPCTEGVRYIVLKTPVGISSNQVQAFPFKSNIRPPQPLNGRTIYSNN